MRKSRTALVAVVFSLLVQAVGMAPTSAASPISLPDPPAQPFTPPGDPLSAAVTGQPNGSARDRNHVPQLTESQVARIESAGSTAVVSEEGLLEFNVQTETGTIRVGLFDTETVSGIEVIGIAFADESELASESTGTVFSLPFGPREARAHQLPYSHTHNLGWPFHDGCSYLYQYGASNDSYVYVCSTDAGNIRYVGNAMSAVMGIVGTPVAGLIGFLAWNIGLSLFQQSDGSLKFSTPGSSLVNHYGWVYWYSNNPYYADWYWYNAQGSPLYCYARKYSNNTNYYVC